MLGEEPAIDRRGNTGFCQNHGPSHHIRIVSLTAPFVFRNGPMRRVGNVALFLGSRRIIKSARKYPYSSKYRQYGEQTLLFIVVVSRRSKKKVMFLGPFRCDRPPLYCLSLCWSKYHHHQRQPRRRRRQSSPDRRGSFCWKDNIRIHSSFCAAGRWERQRENLIERR
jgi:hypothetical protein